MSKLVGYPCSEIALSSAQKNGVLKRETKIKHSPKGSILIL